MVKMRWFFWLPWTVMPPRTTIYQVFSAGFVSCFSVRYVWQWFASICVITWTYGRPFRSWLKKAFFSVVDFLRPMCNTNETRHGDAWTPRVAAVPRSCPRLRKSQLESLLLKSISLGRSAEVTFTNGNDWTSISAAAKANMSVLGPYSSLVTEN